MMSKRLFIINIVIFLNVLSITSYASILDRSLRNAIFNNKIQNVKKLVESGINLNKIDKLGYPPIAYVLHNSFDNVDMFKYLVSKGAKFKGNPILEILAVMHTRKKIMKYMIVEDHYYQKKLNERLIKVLVKYPARHEYPKRIISLGADVNYKNDYGITPLLQSINYNNFEDVKFLISKGAKFESNDIIKLIIKKENIDILKLLISKGIDINYKPNNMYRTLLGIAIENNSIESIKLLVSMGADVNLSSGPSYRSPLILAVNEKNTEVFKYLLDNGADVNYKGSSNNTTVLNYIVKLDDRYSKKRLEFLDMLIPKIDINSSDNYYSFSTACGHYSIDLIKILIEKGIDVNKNFYAIKKALDYNRFDVAQLLIDSGLDINGHKKLDTYPLLTSILGQRKNIEKINFLIKNGININNEDKFMQTAIFKAIYKNELKIIKLLVKNNIDYNHVDKFYRTPLDYAIYNKKEKVIEYLESLDAERTIRSRLTVLFDIIELKFKDYL